MDWHWIQKRLNWSKVVAWQRVKEQLKRSLEFQVENKPIAPMKFESITPYIIISNWDSNYIFIDYRCKRSTKSVFMARSGQFGEKL